MKKFELEELEALMREKSYKELSDEEKDLVGSDLSESDYDNWRNTIQMVNNERERPPKTSTKNRLMTKFKEAKPSITHRILHYQISSSLTAAMLLIAISITYFLVPSEVKYVEKLVQLPPITVVDTVQVISPPDTIYIDRIKEVPTYLTKIVEVRTEADPVEQKSLPGRSLAEQDELKSLIVRSD